MLTVLAKARRAATSRMGASTASTAEPTTSVEPEIDTSDTTSIISQSDKKKRAPTLFNSLSRKPSQAHTTATATVAATLASKSSMPSRSSSMLVETEVTVDSTSSENQVPLTDKPESTLPALKARGSAGGFSVSEQGDWTQVTSLPSRPPVAGKQKPSRSLSGESKDAVVIPIIDVAAQKAEEAQETDRRRIEDEEAQGEERQHHQDEVQDAEGMRLEKEVKAAWALETKIRDEAQEAEIRRLKEEVQSLILERDILSTKLQTATAEMRQLKESWIQECALINAQCLEEKERLQRETEVFRSRMGIMETAIQGGDQARKRLQGELASLTLEQNILSTKLQTDTAEITRVAQETRELRDSWIQERALVNTERLEERERLQREMEVLRSRISTLEYKVAVCPNTAAPDVVRALYQNILDREPESQFAVDFWTQHMQDYGLAQTVGGLFASDEYVAKGLSVEVTVDKFYLAVLGRQAEPGGRAHWAQAMRDGSSPRQVADGFVGSIEYRQKVHAGTAPHPIHWP